MLVLLPLLLLLLAALSSPGEGNLLIPISTDAPPALFPTIQHPFKPRFNSSRVSPPFPTNKFNTYFLYSTSTVSPIFTHPFTLKINPESPYGIYVSHSDEKIFGGGTEQRRQFYFNVVLKDVGFSATQLTSSANHELEALDHFGATISWTAGGKLRVPIVRGMAYVTAIYENLTPLIFTQHAVLTINGAPANGFQATATKFKLELNNNQKWILYSLSPITLSFQNNALQASYPFTGVLRLSKIPISDNGVAEAVLDAHYRKYVTGGTLEVPSQFSYIINWNWEGDQAHELLHYAHLHHQQILSSGIQTVLSLPSSTKGEMKGVIGDRWVLNEPNLPSISWLPPREPDANKVEDIIKQLNLDIQADFIGETNLNSNYFAGKALQKFALICLVADHLKQTGLRDTCISKLTAAFDIFTKNQNINPLRYDQTWGGIVAQSGLTGEPLADFGNSFYNDHHFHFGYFIHSAAILTHLNSSWGIQNSPWVNSLIRDVNNPSQQDRYFVPFRNFDWFAGHSWAQGLFESGDGKDQESTSEEVNYHVGVKMWGLVSGNTGLFNLANLMLAVNIRSLNTYFLMDANNVAHPPQFIGNKVTGIFFENKVDYTTWFSPRVECIHGIQMIPMVSASEEVRKVKFVQEEWELLKDIAPGISDGWASILYTDYAFLDKDFAFEKLKTVALDGGLSRTWALFFAATRPALE